MEDVIGKKCDAHKNKESSRFANRLKKLLLNTIVSQYKQSYTIKSM